MPPQTEPDQPAFLFATCQVGAERALKSEVARLWPAFHFAYSRPGFVTFKLPAASSPPPDFDLSSVFARAWGFSLGKVQASSLDERVAQFRKIVGKRKFDALHVWQRDAARPGFRGFEPHVTSEAREAEAAIRESAPSNGGFALLPAVAAAGQTALDCILVEPDAWWVGYHGSVGGPSGVAGGLVEVTVPADAVSRAYAKIEEALAWSGLPLRAGEIVAEIGCAPGGASQALLARGMRVIGVDPAEVDPRVLAHPKFTFVRKRGADVRRRDFRAVDWLTADMNVAPQYTLDTVEAIVTHPSVNVRGLLLTLKLVEWELAERIPEYLERVGSWGYGHVRARQLVRNRQEICVAAERRKPARRKRANR